jgi:hypothetical protein
MLDHINADNPPSHQKIAKIFPEIRGDRAVDLTILENDLPLAIHTAQNESPRLSAKTDNLQNIAETEIFKISNKAHRGPYSVASAGKKLIVQVA